MSQPRHWLFKSEPNSYAIDDLERDGWTQWDGVRNYQARNLLRDEVRVGDLVLYYHSNAKPPGAVGVARVCKAAYADPTQFDEDSKSFDPKATNEEPRWFVVDVEFVGRFDAVVPLADLKGDAALDGMLVTLRGQRLSVQPVDAKHFARVLEMAGYALG
ncbi:MAG: EVE domain-containing protein [Acidobacteriota bacterium]